MRRTIAFFTVAAMMLVGGIGTVAGAGEGAGDQAVIGAFGAPIMEPDGHYCEKPQDPAPKCKPTAVALAVLPTGDALYWDGLEGMSRVRNTTAFEFGHVAGNSQSRVLSLSGPEPKWSVPDPEDSGAYPRGNPNPRYLPGVPHTNDNTRNDGDLFCAVLVQTGDGKLVAVGGTTYYQEPAIPGTTYGLAELEGLRLTRVYDPATNKWGLSGPMNEARWYPSLVTLPDGKLFVAGGVGKMIKPVYHDKPAESGRNIRSTETYDPATGKWTDNGPDAHRSLPLLPRIHVLPDGNVYYDAAGQVVSPGGEGYDEVVWNLTSVFDTVTKTWKDLGVPMLGPVPLGFRGSSFSVMLPLRPDAGGKYTKAQFLSAGGVLGTWPSVYLANDNSVINTVDTAAGHTMTSEATGPLNNRRWYSSGVVLPTGEVLTVNGADADEVVGPGSGHPVPQAELFDPVSKTWKPMASDPRHRSYHSSAALLPDGRVLVGGHGPINTLYGGASDFGQKNFGWTPPVTDPTFSIYSPPYLFRGERPVIKAVNPSIAYNQPLTINTTDAVDITTVTLIRNQSVTHLVDGDQRSVVLPIISRTGDSVTVSVPGNTVLPPGPYMLFVNKGTPKGEIPSVSRQTYVGGPVPASLADRVH
jgi:galactose oxidase-like protein